MAIGHRLSAIGYRLSAIGHWLSAIGYRLLAVAYWLLAVAYWLSAIGDSSRAPLDLDEKILADNIRCFGEPVCEYDLSQDIEDG